MEIDSSLTAEEYAGRARIARIAAAEQYVISRWSDCARDMARHREAPSAIGNPVEMIRCTWTLSGLVASALEAHGEDVEKVNKRDPVFVQRLFDYVVSVIDAQELRQFGVRAECWFARRPNTTPEYRIYFLRENRTPVSGIQRL